MSKKIQFTPGIESIKSQKKIISINYFAVKIIYPTFAAVKIKRQLIQSTIR